MTVTYHVGDTRDVIATIPDGSVSLVACSPPFLALRSYLPADHPDKHAEIGSEPDPATFLDTLLALTADWGRVLAPWGSIAIELGDTFAGSGGAGGDYNADGMREGQHKFDGSASGVRRALRQGYGGAADRLDGTTPKNTPNWPRAKCLALIPQLYATSLAYGRNILTGEPSPAGQWLVRNMIVWHRPNPAVGALGDKFRPCTSYITVATRSPKRWFDLTAVRGETARDYSGEKPCKANSEFDRNGGGRQTTERLAVASPAGAPPLDAWFDHHDTWTVTTQPSRLAHYAMWPAKLAERLILSMCPSEVCSKCREPRRRIEQPSAKYAAIRGAVGGFKAGRDRGTGLNGTTQYHNGEKIERADNVTTGWTDCGCDEPFTPGVVLDPFAGTGTTLAVADLHGRDAIGIDIDPRNPLLYEARRAECARNLHGTAPELPGQLDMFGATA